MQKVSVIRLHGQEASCFAIVDTVRPYYYADNESVADDIPVLAPAKTPRIQVGSLRIQCLRHLGDSVGFGRAVFVQ